MTITVSFNLLKIYHSEQLSCTRFYGNSIKHIVVFVRYFTLRRTKWCY